jgi:hypothetical protein
LLRSLQEIEPDFEEETKAYTGLWIQGRKEGRSYVSFALKSVVVLEVFEMWPGHLCFHRQQDN